MALGPLYTHEEGIGIEGAGNRDRVTGTWNRVIGNWNRVIGNWNRVEENLILVDKMRWLGILYTPVGSEICCWQLNINS